MAHGGHARYTHELLSALSMVGLDKGVQVSLVTSQDLSPNFRTPLYTIYDILPPLKPRAAFSNSVQWAWSRTLHYLKRERIFLRWIEQNEEIQGVHIQDYQPWQAPRTFRFLKARGKLLFGTVHNVYNHWYYPGIPRTIQYSWDRVAWNLCDALFVHTEGMRDQVSEFLGKGHPPIFVQPHGARNDADSLAGALSYEERIQCKRLLFFGIIRPNKGLDVLLRAMEGLPDYTLTIAGEPLERGYKEHIRALVDKLPPTQVKLIDRFIEEDEIDPLFAQSSLLILPYTTDFAGQSGVLHLAVAYGLPVVATDVGAVGESLRRWNIGRLAPPNEPTALAGAIQEMFAPQCYWQASRALAQVRNDTSWTRAAEILVGTYHSTWQHSQVKEISK